MDLSAGRSQVTGDVLGLPLAAIRNSASAGECPFGTSFGRNVALVPSAKHGVSAELTGRTGDGLLCPLSSYPAALVMLHRPSERPRIYACKARRASARRGGRAAELVGADSFAEARRRYLVAPLPPFPFPPPRKAWLRRRACAMGGTLHHTPGYDKH